MKFSFLTLCEMLASDDPRLIRLGKRELANEYGEAGLRNANCYLATREQKYLDGYAVRPRHLKKMCEGDSPTQYLIIEMVRCGDADVSDAGGKMLVDRYSNYIWNMIHTHYQSFKGIHEDLFAAGQLGLVEACAGYDLDSNVDFPTFADKFIRGRIGEEVRNFVGGVTPTRHFENAQKRLDDALQAVGGEINGPDDYNRVRELSGLSDRQLKTELRIHETSKVSYEAMGADDRESCGDIGGDPAEKVESELAKQKILKWIDDMTKIDPKVEEAKKRPYKKRKLTEEQKGYLLDHILLGVSYDEIAEAYGISHEQAREACTAGMAAIRRNFNADKWAAAKEERRKERMRKEEEKIREDLENSMVE